jgi:site-specific DNA-cytosine methylase
MNVIYLAAGNAVIKKYNNIITYNDLLIKRDIQSDMMSVDLLNYDLIIASPPCNFYSRARGNFPPSDYALKTKHLLPEILTKAWGTGKPFIIENVINKVKMKDIIKNFNGFYYEHGRHSYFTNIMFNPKGIPQNFDFKFGGIFINKESDRQGGKNVNIVLQHFIDFVLNKTQASA